MFNDALTFLKNKYERDKIILENRLKETKQVEAAKLSLQFRSFSNTRSKSKLRIKNTQRVDRDEILKMNLHRRNYSQRLLVH